MFGHQLVFFLYILLQVGFWLFEEQTRGSAMCIFCKKMIIIWSCEAIKIPMYKTSKYNKYLQIQHMYYAVFFVFGCSKSCFFLSLLDCVLLFMFHWCAYSNLDQCTNSFNILTYKIITKSVCKCDVWTWKFFEKLSNHQKMVWKIVLSRYRSCKSCPSLQKKIEKNIKFLK